MTVLADLSFEPSTFREYVQRDIAKRNAFIQSGSIVASGLVVPETGRTVTVPAWDGLAGEAEVLSDTGELTETSLDSSKQVAPILARGKLYGYNDLVQTMSGSDPAGALAQKLGTFWSREYDRVAVHSAAGAALGIDADVGAGSVVRDVSALSDGTEVISASNIIQTRGLFGEYQDLDMNLVVHSDVFTALNEQDLIDTERNSAGQLIQVYQGMPVIVSNTAGLKDGTDYRTLMVRQAGMLSGVNGDNLSFFEQDRNIKSGNNLFATRQRFVIHPASAQWTGTPAGVTATNAELLTAGNWVLGAQSVDSFGIRMLVHVL